MFLAHVFPLSERSGVNSSGAFNTNPTPFDSSEAATAAEAADVSVDVDAPSAPTDFGLYRTFWGVQELLASPQKILANKDAWATFIASLTTICSAFDGQGVVLDGDVEEGEEGEEGSVAAVPKASPSASPSGGGDGSATGAGAGDDVDVGAADGGSNSAESDAAAAAAIEEFYCTKYLTNSQLFNLQVRGSCLMGRWLPWFSHVIALD